MTNPELEPLPDGVLAVVTDGGLRDGHVHAQENLEAYVSKRSTQASRGGATTRR